MPSTTRSTPCVEQRGRRPARCARPRRPAPATSTASAMARTTARLTGVPGAGGVEVDDVQPAGAGGREPAGQRHGVAVGCAAGRSPLDQADGAAVAQVDGGVELHGSRPRRPDGTGVRRVTARRSWRRMARPTAPDFSGWNWVPHTGPTLGGGHHLAAVVTGGHDVVAVSSGAIGVDEVDPRIARPGPARSLLGRHRRRSTSWFHCICGRLTPRAATAPSRQAPRARRTAGASSDPS